MKTPRPTGHAIQGRRGMLLLLVLSMLTLFVLMGALALVIATRARTSARAFADFNGGGNNAPVIAKTMLDEALLLLIRGSKDPAVNGLLGNDSLLKDMYGTTGGRFDDEGYDSFDDSNRFMTQVSLDAMGRVASVPRPAFANRGTAATVDNDSDGVLDSVWIPAVPGGPGLLPPLSVATGKPLGFRVSYLVLDLDGRVNVNTHGGRMEDLAINSGGPAEVNPAPLWSTGSTIWSQTMLMAGNGVTTSSSTPLPADQWRRPPVMGRQVSGRFGGFTGGTNAGGQTEFTYSLRLDLDAPRPAVSGTTASQNPFTLGELERVLRQFDPDASTLPPRLAAIFHDQAERARMRITTDSWSTPGDRYEIRWEADNSGVVDERTDWAAIWPLVVLAGAPEADAKQWVANLLDFRDKDVASTPFAGGVRGVEPSRLTFVVPGGWDDGRFRSYAELLAVPRGTETEIEQRKADNQPLVSLIKDYPKILDYLAVTFFKSTLDVNPNREPGRVNINTCDGEVWKVLLGSGSTANPFETPSDPGAQPRTPARHMSEILLQTPLVFSDASYDVRSVNHTVANRLANVATVRSHVFAVWITLEITDPDAPDQPTYHRLFAIVDRSILVPFTAATEGKNENFRDIIRLRRFLN